MPDTHGFETVVEASAAVLRKVLRSAWKSAECGDSGSDGRIPENIDIPPPAVEFGGYQVIDGQIQLPQDELDAFLAPGVGTDLQFGLHMQFEIASPPVPSARLFDMVATVTARAPIDTGGDGRSVFIFLDQVARGDVNAVLTSGDPLAPKLDQILTEFVHKAYENNGADPAFPSLPHVIEETDVVWSYGFGASVTVDVYAHLYDDPGNPAHRIEVTRPQPDKLRISIPIYLRIYNVRKSGAAAYFDIRSPMGLETRIVLEAPFESPPGSYTGRLSQATATVGTISPAPYQPEGANYEHNRDNLPISIEPLVRDELTSRGIELAHDFGDFTVDVPTVAEIETAIEDLFHAELITRGQMSVWHPQQTEDFAINDVTVNVIAEALVMAINRRNGADVTSIDGFIPADREFAIGLDGPKVLELVEQARVDQGLSDSDLPKRMRADGKDVDLNGLDVGLKDGALRVTGDVTVIDAVAGSIDVDASFDADVGLHWEPDGALNAAGVQELKHHQIGEPDIEVDEGWLLGLLLGLLGLLTGGFLGALIGVIVALIVLAIASNIGTSLVRDTVSNLPIGVGAWPSELAHIGQVIAVFRDPVIIQSNGLVIAGTLEVVSTCENTAVVPADSGGTYSAAAATPVPLSAGNVHPDAAYGWLPGDGSPAQALPALMHVYDASGLYIAKHKLTVNQSGGATTRHFALVDVANVPPVVDAGPDIEVDEGEMVTLVGRFWDVEYADTHESSWVFGDDQSPKAGIVQETNSPPQAVGTSTVQHAWCDNGEYTVVLRVRDQNGGTTTDTRRVTVRNVAPRVDAGPPVFAYPCMPITLRARFEDPGWCDTHTGTWDCGDCTGLHAGIVRETNEPPAARGTLSVAHIYERCGSYRAVATVVDDDGGVGVDETTVHVVELASPGFEEGFRPLAVGRVANGWEPYVVSGADTKALAAAMAAAGEGFPQVSKHLYDCDECVVREGQRSQRITAPAGGRIGIFQSLGSNEGWRYQFSAFYTLHESFGGSARLGIDPAGGSDPAAADVVWTTGTATGDWVRLAEEVTARARAVTVFLDVAADDRNLVDGWFDQVEFVAFEPHCPPEEPPPDDSRCVRFEERTHETTHVVDGFRFANVSGEPLMTVIQGPPPGALKLLISAGGLEVRLPFVSRAVHTRVVFYGGKPVQMLAFNASGGGVGEATGPSATETPAAQTLRVEASGITYIVLTGQEAALYEVCAWPEDADHPEGRPTAVAGAGLKDVVRELEDPLGYASPRLRKQAEEVSGVTPAPPHEIPPKAWAKFDEPLRRAVAVAKTPDALFPVLIELGRDAADDVVDTAGSSRKDVESRRVAFEAVTRELRDRLEKRGARDMRALWVASAIACRAPMAALIEASLDDRTRRLSQVTKRRVLLEDDLGER